MSRLTGKEVYSLMEAYQAVYAPQELTEEQVWEGVENWVHSLLEEGYDLSDYTWEEMYENYLTESPALAIPLAPYAAPYALPALGAAAALIKNNLNKTNKMVTTPDEERFLNTGSFASRQDDPNKQPAKKSGGEGFGNTPKDDDKGTKITNVPGPNIRGKQPVEPPKVDPPTKQPVEQPPKQPVEQPPTKPPVDPPVKRSVYDRKGEFLPGKPGDVQLHRNFYPYRSVFDRKVEFLPGKPGDVQLHRNFYPYNQLPVQPRTNDPGGRGPNLTITTDPVKIVKPVVRVKPSDFNSSGRDQLINRPPVKKEVKPEVKKEVKPEVKKEVKPEVKKEGEPGQSSRQSVIPRTSATPVNSGPNFLQRKVAQFRTGYVGSSGASTAERLGNVVGAGAKLTKGGAEFAAKNFVTKPIGAIGGLGAIAGIGGLAGYGLYKAGKYGYNKYKENQPKSKNFPPPPERLTNQFQNFESDNLNVINEGPNFPTTKPKSNYDQLTIGGITKLWDPASNSYQLPGTINKRLESEGEDLITVPGKAKPDPVTPLTPAQRATQQRLDAGVVKGGKSGFKSLVPKPTPQKRESAEKFKARQSRYEDSQRLAQTLTQSQQKTADAAAKATADAAAKATADAAAKATADAAAKATADAAAKATADAAAKAKADAEKAKTRTATTGTATTGTATTGTATTGTTTTRTTTQKPPTLPPVSVAQTGNRNTDLTTWANANKGMINKVGTQQQKDILSAVESGKPVPKAPESIKDQVKNMQKIRMQSESTAYDIVLDYLISTNQVDTIEEAHYVMMQLDSEYIGNIVEEWRPVENLDEKARGTRKKKNIHAYDVDETLFKHGEKGKPTVQVHVNDSSGKRVQSLSNQDFNTHKLDKDKGHSYDFSEFQNAKKFGETSSPNKKVIKDLKRKQARGQNVHIITARSKFDNPSEFQGHLQKHGIDIPKNKIHYTGGMKGSDVGTKKVDTAKGIAKQSGAKQISMYDDAPKVNNAFEKEKQNNSTFTRIKTYLAKPNASGETTLRSYQATK